MNDSRRQIERLVVAARANGFVCDRSKRSSHWLIKAPNGEMYVAASTPSDSRGPKNVRSWLRRHGLPRQAA